ncbi:unnamed protein product [Caenorhabditis brenneri]
MIFLAFFVLIAATTAQVPPGGGVGVVGPGVPVCNGNENFTSCGPCDGYCSDLNPVCEEKCTTGCLCNPGYVRDAEKKCIKVEDCPNTNQCGPNEEFRACYDACEDVKCFPTEEPCAKPCECKPGCTCTDGFVRDAYGKCVPPAQCGANPCDSKKCGCGEECVLVNVNCVRAPCNPVAECHPIATDCSNKNCTTLGGCAMVQAVTCQNLKCPKWPQCINENQCLHTRCPRGFQCVLQEPHGCTNRPCEPEAKCMQNDDLLVEVGPQL